MPTYDSRHIRNVAILGHQGSGKTSLVESLAYVSKLIPEKGTVERKDTLSDYSATEQKRGTSTQASVIPLFLDDYKVNIIDIPGNDDFIGEAIGVTGVIKGAVLVIDASVGVQVGTVKHWKQLRKKGVPTFIFINKMDKEAIDFEALLEEIRERFGTNVISFCYPLGHDDQFDGFANAVDLKAHVYNGKECVEAEIYPDKRARVFELHNTIVEEVAKVNDELLEKFFAGEEFTPDEINAALKQSVIAGDITPVIVGSATKNIGVQTLLRMMIEYLPSPADLKPLEAQDEEGKDVVRPTEDDAPFSAYVFKTLVDPYSGVINIVKVCSGVLKAGDEVYYNGNTTKITSLFMMTGKKLDPITEIHAGDIAAITKLEGVHYGDTLSSPKAIIKYKPVHYPTAVIYKAILVDKTAEGKLVQALAKIQMEDPCVEVTRNNETKQLLLGGVSDTHIDFILDKIKTIYKINVETERMKIVYRESIKGTAEGDGRYVKQTGGSGFYGVVKMRFEPAEENEFAEEVFGGAVPKNYFPAVEKGFYEALQKGVLAGFPVIGVKGTLLDGKYHPVDSNEQAFRMAAILAYRDAAPKCKPIILEPILRIFVNVESKYTGAVLSDLNTRRARIQNIEEKDFGNQEIEALIPEAEVIDYTTTLKSITQASGFYNREFCRYEEVPESLKERVIRDNKIE
ncbi:MAG: elongation factor G [Bacilli bacterium]|nr:elongation factor G [Bacilli bacterium]